MTIIYSSKPLREREEHDFYPTPYELCRASLDLLPITHVEDVLDAGAGTGVWGKAVVDKYDSIWSGDWVYPGSYEFPRIDGIEIRNINKPISYDEWIIGDFLETSLEKLNRKYYYDLVIGNPPYRLAEEFIHKGLELTGEYLLFLLRLSFLESKTRYTTLYNAGLNPWKVAVSTRRVSFTGNKKSDNTAYAIYIWKKDWTGTTELTWLDWDYKKDK